jgi:hypothetical protein
MYCVVYKKENHQSGKKGVEGGVPQVYSFHTHQVHPFYPMEITQLKNRD